MRVLKTVHFVSSVRSCVQKKLGAVKRARRRSAIHVQWQHPGRMRWKAQWPLRRERACVFPVTNGAVLLRGVAVPRPRGG